MSPDFAGHLCDGETVFSSWHMLPSGDLLSLAAEAGFAAVVLDMQHGGHGYESLVDACARMAFADAALGVRIAAHDYAFAGRAVDAGAEFVIAPLINTFHDAQALVQAVKYPPVGGRSWGAPAAMRYGCIASADEQLASANDRVVALAMIETVEGVDNLEAILAVDGLDGVFVGPSDLSIALSQGARFDPFGEESLPVIEQIAAASLEAEKIPGIFTTTPEQTSLAQSFGYRFISVTTDMRAFSSGLSQYIPKDGPEDGV